MINNLEDFTKSVSEFSTLSSSTLIDYFSYYIIHFENKSTIKAKEIENCFEILKIPSYSNIPKYLSENSKKSRGKVQKFLKNTAGYSLTRDFSNTISKNIIIDIPKIEISNTLRSLIPRLNNESEKQFLEEAIKTFEVEAYRASILMTWLLTIDHLYEYILANKLQDFIAALRRANNSKSIRIKDDFGDIKESQFIEVARSAGIISNDVRKILDTKLGIRNSFAHPSTIHLGKTKAIEFIEDLVTNVILKY